MRVEIPIRWGMEPTDEIVNNTNKLIMSNVHNLAYCNRNIFGQDIDEKIFGTVKKISKTHATIYFDVFDEPLRIPIDEWTLENQCYCMIKIIEGKHVEAEILKKEVN